MTEPTSTTLAASAAGAGVATSMIPGVDSNALIGAIAGAALFVMTAKDLPLWRRLVYMGISVAAGYEIAPEVMARTSMQASGAAAFLVATTVITISLQLIERMKTLDLSILFKRGE